MHNLRVSTASADTQIDYSKSRLSLSFHEANLNGVHCKKVGYMSRDMTKQTKSVCAQRRLRSAWASAQSDQSLRCPHEESLGP